MARVVLRSEGLGKEESEDKEQGHGAAAARGIVKDCDYEKQS